MAFEVLPLTSIGIIMVLAIVLSFLVKKSGQNAVLGYIIAGFLLGPLLVNFLSPKDPMVAGFGELGLFILLFYLGLEMSLKDFLKAGSTSFGLAIIDMIASTGIGLVIATISGFSLLFSIIVGMMAFSTSTAVVAKFALDKGLIQNSAAKLAISILILQDFLGIVVLVFLTSFSKNSGDTGISLGIAAIVFAVSAFFAVSKVSKIVEEWLSSNGFGHTEVTLFALGLGLIVATVGTLLGLSMALGAYFAGFALAETKSGDKIKKDVEFLRDFMLVFFFVAFGTTLFFSSVTSSIQLPAFTTLLFLFAVAAAVAVGAILAHSIVTHLFGAKFGLTREDCTLVAILLVPLGEFVIIIATSAVPVLTGVESTLISPIAFMLILITVVVFQPLYNLKELHQKAFSVLPSLFASSPVKTEIKEHTPESIVYLKKFGLNLFVIICFAWSTFLIYEELPRFGVPLLYSREITAFFGFCFFAVWPAIAALKALKKLFEHAFRKQRKIRKFASLGIEEA
jgi:CPA2 family monovalent cation:H+ antiporter-2